MTESDPAETLVEIQKLRAQCLLARCCLVLAIAFSIAVLWTNFCKERAASVAEVIRTTEENRALAEQNRIAQQPVAEALRQAKAAQSSIEANARRH